MNKATAPSMLTWLITLAAVAIFAAISGVNLHHAGQAATGPQFTECFAAKVWQGDGPSVSAGEIPKTLKIPAGWTVVGGTTAAFGNSAAPAALLCR